MWSHCSIGETGDVGLVGLGPAPSQYNAHQPSPSGPYLPQLPDALALFAALDFAPTAHAETVCVRPDRLVAP
jgi:hypothetical protein